MMSDRAPVALLLTTLLLIAPVSVAAAPAVPQETLARANRHLKYAERHLERKEYDQAIQEYRLVGSWVPQARIDYFLGHAYALKGDRARALQHLRRYLAAAPDGEHAAAARRIIEGDAAPDPVAGGAARPLPDPPAASGGAPGGETAAPAGAGASPTLGQAAGAGPASPGAPAEAGRTAGTTKSVPQAALPPPPEPTASTSPPAAPAATATSPAPVVVKPHERKPIHRRWWFWTLIGTATAQSAVGITLGATASQRFQPTLPDTASTLLGRF